MQKRKGPLVMLNNSDVVIAEHLDPCNLAPGGIDSIIHDIVKFADRETKFSIVGVASNSDLEINVWHDIAFAGRRVNYLPVAILDRSRTTGLLGKIPHSFQFCVGLIRSRNELPKATYHAHRVETGFCLRKLLGRPVVQFIHNDSAGLLGKGSDSFWRKIAWIYRLLEKSVMKQAARVVLFNKTDSSRLGNLRPDLIVSRTWFDSEVFKTTKDAKIDQAFAGNTRTRICWIGRLDSQKDPLLALDVLAALLARGVDCEMTMVGDGSLFDSVRTSSRDQGLTERLNLLGPRSRAEVASVMATSDVLLMTSRYEGSPVVLLEAGASGLPVVATEESDPDHALVSGSNGERIKGRDSIALAQAIQQASSYSSSVCREMAEPRTGKTSVPRLLTLIDGPAFPES